MVGWTSLNVPSRRSGDTRGRISTSGTTGLLGGEEWGNKQGESRRRDRPGLEWRRALMAALVLGVLPLAAMLRVPEHASSFAVAHAVVWLELQIVLGATGAMFFTRWRLDGEARHGWLSAALVMMSLSGTPFATADLADIGQRFGGTGDAVSLVLAVPVVALMLLAVSGSELPARIHPLVLGTCLGLLMLAVRILAGPGVADSFVFPQPEGAIVMIALSAGYLMTLVLRLRQRDPASPMTSQFVAVIASLLAVMLLDPVGTNGDVLMSRASSAALFLLSVWVLLAGVSVLLDSLSAHADQIHDLAANSPAAVTAAEERRHREELFHELRSTVADISTASQILLSNDDRLSASSRDRLAAGLSTEVARLQRLVDVPVGGSAATTVALDQVISPLVGCQRAAGHDIRWEPGGHQVVGRQDDLSEIVHILLHNSLRHAPGTPIHVSTRPRAGAVELRVSDGGPGIPEAIRDSLFQRGVRSAESPGSGLGLYLARRLAEKQGGDLQLRHNDGVHGVTFVVTLPQGQEEHT